MKPFLDLPKTCATCAHLDAGYQFCTYQPGDEKLIPGIIRDPSRVVCALYTEAKHEDRERT